MDAGRRLAPAIGVGNTFEDFYWRVIVAAAALPFIGLIFFRDRAELWLHAIGAAAVLMAVSTLF